MIKIIAQMVGLLQAVVIVITFQLKSKRNFLISSLINIALGAINLFLLKEYSGFYSMVVVLVQIILGLFHCNKDESAKPLELCLYAIVYIIIGVFSYSKFVDVLAPIAAIVDMFGIANKNTQTARKIFLVQGIINTSYMAIIGSSLVLSGAINIIAVVVGLYKNRGKKSEK